MTVKLLTEHHFEFLSFKGGCTGSSESTHVKMPHCWKSQATAHNSFSVSLIGVDLGNTSTRMSRFANYLRNLIPSNDVTVMEMAAKAVGILAVSSGAFAAEYVEFEMKRVLEWLTGDRNEGRRHAAVSITRP